LAPGTCIQTDHALRRVNKSNNGVTFAARTGETFRSPASLIFRTHNAMNSNKFILLSCAVSCVFAVSTATAQMMGQRASTARMPMHRVSMLGPTARMPMHHNPMLGPTARTPMHRVPTLGPTVRTPIHRASTLGTPIHRGSISRMATHQTPALNSTSRFQRFGDGDFDRDDGFRRFNEIIIFDNFGFPFSPFFVSPFFGSPFFDTSFFVTPFFVSPFFGFPFFGPPFFTVVL